MTLSVVVCTTGSNPTSLLKCLSSLADQSVGKVKIVLVTRKELPDFITRLTTKTILEPARGLSLARNIGISKAYGDIIAFTDDDCVCHSNWVENLISHFDNPRVGMVTGRTLTFGSGVDITHIQNPIRAIYDRPIPQYWNLGHGNNMAGKRELILRLGLFDEQLGAGGRFNSADDTDMFYKTLLSHHLIVYEPSAIVYHQRTDRKTYFSKMSYYYRRGEGALYRKYYHSPINPSPLRMFLDRNLEYLGLMVKGVAKLHPVPAAEGFLSALSMTFAFCSYGNAKRMRRNGLVGNRKQM
jgi:glycosyltransferase involved in cell wall biosynthesis